MTTSNQVHARLPLTAGGNVTQANTLKAVQMGISSSWPFIKVPKYAASAGTLSSQTFTYSLSALTDLTSEGISRLFVEPIAATDGPPIMKRAWRDYKDSSGDWQIEVSPGFASEFNGKDFGVFYGAMTADVTSGTADIDLPEDYLIAFASWWYANFALTVPESRRSFYTDRIVIMKDEWMNKLKAHATLGFDKLQTNTQDNMGGSRRSRRYPYYR